MLLRLTSIGRQKSTANVPYTVWNLWGDLVSLLLRNVLKCVAVITFITSYKLLPFIRSTSDILEALEEQDDLDIWYNRQEIAEVIIKANPKEHRYFNLLLSSIMGLVCLTIATK